MRIATIFTALITLCVGLAPLRAHARPAALTLLSKTDRLTGSRAAMLAGHNPVSALHWLLRTDDVANARLGADQQTIAVRFRDGASLVILPAGKRSISLRVLAHARSRRSLQQSSGASARAIVLEPFATELGLGANAGSAVIGDLQTAGFQVDVSRNSDVTVASLQHLSDYSAVYLDTHAGVLQNGDAVLVTGETNTAPYADYYRDGSLIQASVAGDPSQTLYNGITGKFLLDHVGAFPPDTLFFLNGCSALSAPLFWQDVHQQGVQTLVSWDNESQVSVNEASASLLMSSLAGGSTVQDAVRTVTSDGLGSSIVNGTFATLGYRGWGGNTLHDVLTGTLPSVATTIPLPSATGTAAPSATPSPMPSPTPTASPTNAIPVSPSFSVRIAHHRIRVGERQIVFIRTSAGAAITIAVQFPSGARKHHGAHANASGAYQWSFVQPARATRVDDSVAHLTVHVRFAGGTVREAHRSYTIES